MSPRTRADLPVLIVMVFAIFAFLLFFNRYARAANLPNGMTCEQVVQAAKYLNIPNTGWGRAQARIIALTFGVVLTDAQIAEAARCLPHKEK